MKRTHAPGRLRAAAIALVLLFLPTRADAGEEPFAIAPPPSWVIPTTPGARKTSSADRDGGEVVVLFDQQIDAGAEEAYGHVVRDIVNEAGVQEGSQISVDFDPAYQSLTFHHVHLVRDGRVLDRLQRDEVKMLQQERDLERHIYNGALSAVLFLEDVRPGDRIDYAFSVRGANPILGGRFADSFPVEWSVPMQRQRFRLVWPVARALSIRNHGTTTEPVVRALAAEEEYVWEVRDPRPITPEDAVPASHDAYGWVELSEFPSWAAVATWAAELYPPAPLPPELASKVEEWRGAGSSAEARLLAALQFVQDDVRYLGLEFGVNSHRPTPPGTVFERRFGDCKDKTYLLCAVLQALDIEAAPALVHTGYRARVAERLPSPYAFDHVVARVRLGDREAWVDPTRSHQRGPLSARWFPDFGRALIVDASTVALTTIPPATKGLPKTTVQETFTIRGPKDAVEMRIVTTTEGADAETMRAMLASSPLDEISRSYLNFYARHYPRIEVSQELRVIDTPESNILKIFEQYRIEEFWSLSDDERAFTADFYPWTLAAVVAGPSTHRRSMPLAIAHPLRQSVRTEVKLPELWPVVEEPVTFATPAGRTSIRRRMTGTTLSMEFDHVSLASEIGVAEVPEYLDTLERIDESFGYQLTWQNPDGPAALFQPNWSILMLAAFCLVLLAIGAALTYRWQPAVATPALASNETTPARPRLEGLGGWLVFVALGLFLTPITAASFFVQTYAVYSTEQWNALTVPGTETYHAYWAPYLIFALVGNLTSLVLALLLLVLFFGKRRSFPRIYIGFLIFQTLAMAIDFVGARQLSALLEESDLVESTNDLVRSVGACAIWIPYMVVSRRVRSTFVR